MINIKDKLKYIDDEDILTKFGQWIEVSKRPDEDIIAQIEAVLNM